MKMNLFLCLLVSFCFGLSAAQTDKDSSIAEDLKSLKAKVEALEGLIEKERTKVIFSVAAGEEGTVGPFDTNTTLNYSRVITNIGGAYSSSTGIFTAPVAGVYYFTFFYHAGGEHESKLFLYKNDEVMVLAQDHPSDSDTADNGGNAVFLQLQQGDRVFVKMADDTHVWGSEHHTTFSGFLVTQM